MSSLLFARGASATATRPPSSFLHALARFLGVALVALVFAGSIGVSRAQVFLNEIVDPNDRIGPTGLAIDTVGTTTYLYAVDNNGGRVIKYNLATGARVAAFGSVGNGPGEFLSPYGIAVDPVSHDLYVAERGNNRVQRIRSTDGSYVMTWGGRGSAGGQFIEPIGVATDAAGNVYVTDHGNHRVQKFTVQGGTAHLQTIWGSLGAAAGQFNQPYGITVDRNGNVWVADAMNGRVQRFNASGAHLATIGAGLFDTPTWIGFDAAGNYYVTDTNRDPQSGVHPSIQKQRIHKISAADTLISTWGSVGEAGGQFRLPFSIVVDAAGFGYVADYYNTRIQKFNLNQNLPLGAPKINSVLTANGTAKTAFLYNTFAAAYPAATTFAATGLPAGLTINAANGAISGVPTVSGAFSVNLSATNSAGTGTATLALTIAGAPGSPVISSATTAAGNAGAAFTYQITASNSPTSYSATGLPAGLTVNAATGVISGTPTTAGTYTVNVSATNAIGTNSANVTITIGASTGGNSNSRVVAQGGSVQLTATVAAGATVQWQHNGTTISGATAATHTVSNAQPASAGVYTALVTSGGSTTTQAFVLGISLPATTKVIGSGREVGPDIVHQNGRIYDQILLEGPATTFRADANQVTRCSYLDVDGDIVQVEFSGAGTVSIVLDPASYTAPATPTKYNQPTVAYARGHATIVVAGTDQTSNLTVFSVGRATAINQALFRNDVTYEGVSSISTVGIHSANGRFGGLRTANGHYFNTKGITGIYAPGVTFDTVVYIGEITAETNATSYIHLGTSTDVSVRGGSLQQLNGRAVQVSGFDRLPFVANVNSHNVAQPAQNCAATLMRNGQNVTQQVVVNPN